METRFKAHSRLSGQDYWFDITWGNGPGGSGYIGMVPLGEERVYAIRDNRISVDPDDCDITPFEPQECEGCKRWDALLAERNQTIEQLNKDLREEVHKVNTLLKGESYPG